ncbi:UNKNOWN [Stylonychia lemnae]|uniref:Nad-dependent epimerase dehydratase n=1 Tax=Stylonychia lemnae TaxID=5949 RepID=A0A078B509_STYLE|nr:UNKNOWN [Stylonychia lemnae]|eukprot:CDW88623.1 UNKNOWN [Stylonychia lemnae]
MLAATKPKIHIVSMSRRNVDEQRIKDQFTSQFKNVTYYQGDCLKPETYPKDLEEFDAIIHSVGAIMEGFDYKEVLQKGMNSKIFQKRDPINIIQQLLAQGMKPKYDESLEAMNRDSCKLMAEHFNNACKKQDKKGHFVFISASKSITPVLQKYSDMKEQAESFLLNNCPEIIPVILRPGFVWSENERSWSVPVKVANDFGYELKKKVLPLIPESRLIDHLFPQSQSTKLSLLADFAIQGALGQLDDLNKSHIWTNEKMNEMAK